MKSFIEVRANVNQQGTNGDSHWVDTYSFHVSYMSGTVLGARDAAVTWQVQA